MHVDGGTTRAVARPAPVRALRIALVVLVLVGVAAGSWWWRGRDLVLADAEDAPPLGEAGRSPAGELVVADLPGVRENYDRVRTFPAAAAMKFLTDDEVDRYQDGGASAAQVSVSHVASTSMVVLATRMASANAARDTVDQLTDLQLDYGLSELPLPEPGVAAASVTPPDGPAVYRASYTHRDVLVRIEVRGPAADDPAARFDALVEDQVRVLSADG